MNVQAPKTTFLPRILLVFVGSNTNEKLTLKSNSSIHIDGITITPSTDYMIADTKISKLATTSNTIDSSINRSYYFTKTIPSFLEV